MEMHSGKRKRSSDQDFRNPQLRRKHSQFGGDQEQALPTPDDTTYRILCASVRIGSVIGKGGAIIKNLRRETNARIKVLDPVPGAEERVVLIWSTQQDEERRKNRENRDSTKHKEEREDREDSDNKRTEPYFPDGLQILCPAQDALFKVHAKILEDEKNTSNLEDNHGNSNHHQQPGEVVARLLVPNNQIGCLLGKGGRIIEKMRNETGAQIRISSRDTLPACAAPTDELVQVSGDLVVVKKALYQISARIYESPLRDRPQGPLNLPPPPPLPPRGTMYPPPNMLPPMYGGGNSAGAGPGYGGMEPAVAWNQGNHPFPPFPHPGVPPMDMPESGKEEDFSVRMLCSNDRIGMVIGKGGNTIRHLRSMTGARIKVEDAVSDADERVIAISATEFLQDHSPVIEAALKLLVKINDGGDNEGLLTGRLLVPSKQIGCLLGKRGSVITEMRKKTTASIKVLQKVDLPKCALDSDELVQIIGDEHVARQAFIEVLSRLRCNVFGMELDDFYKYGGPPKGAFVPPPPNVPIKPDVGFPAGPPPSLSRRSDGAYRGSTFSHNGYGMQGGQYDANHSSLPPSTSLPATGSGYGSFSDYDSGSYGSRMYGDGGLSEMSRNSSSKVVEMTIPGVSASSVLGKGGSNLSSIRQISGAKLTVLEPNPLTGDRVVEIYGAPEQTQAAQSLLQAFIASGQSSASGARGLY
ncbi:hypothetical protein KP509_24G065400 [Ceratopteris richardii]|uniref:K Homology domain-containing protein n=1 Tax=Ceratopteris richardii TaxID=49495 RepID=A0A8T2RXA5_CERRI|nr:hypothetical protein KP509_24G065400 [Ceratopteris richardii]